MIIIYHVNFIFIFFIFIFIIFVDWSFESKIFRFEPENLTFRFQNIFLDPSLLYLVYLYTKYSNSVPKNHFGLDSVSTFGPGLDPNGQFIYSTTMPDALIEKKKKNWNNDSNNNSDNNDNEKKIIIEIVHFEYLYFN